MVEAFMPLERRYTTAVIIGEVENGIVRPTYNYARLG
jgi:hypothetical protein